MLVTPGSQRVKRASTVGVSFYRYYELGWLVFLSFFRWSLFWPRYLTIILRNRAEYRLVLSQRDHRPSRIKSCDISQD